MFSDRTDTTLSDAIFFTFPLHDFMLQVTAAKREWIIKNVCSIISFPFLRISEINNKQDDEKCETTSITYSGVRDLVLALDDDVGLTSTSE